MPSPTRYVKPTSASWLNLIERFFGELTDKRTRRGTFRSVPELIKAIDDYIAHHNDFPSTFTWTAKVEDILSKVARARKRLDKGLSCRSCRGPKPLSFYRWAAG